MAKGWVYLAGGMGGHDFEQANKWRIDVQKNLSEHKIITHSPMRAKDFLKGHIIDENQFQYQFPLAQPPGITTRDRFDLMRCDLVLMNLLSAEDIVSIGTCIEIGWADAFRKPIVLACQKDGKYDKHPMIQHMVGFKVYNLNDAVEIVKAILLTDNMYNA